MRIRAILLAAPVVVVLVFVAAFAISRPYFGVKQDALVMASTADPEILNPVLSTTTAASTIQSFVFDTLMKLDENAEITTDLARSYELTQTTHLYFETPEQARGVLQAVEAHKEQWKDIGLTAATTHDDALVLELTQAGTGYQETVLAWFAPIQPLKVQRWQGQVDTAIRWKDSPASSDVLLAWLKKDPAVTAGKPRLLYAWKNTSGSFELYTVGADGAWIDDLNRRFAEDGGAEGRAAPTALTEPAPARPIHTTAAAPASRPADEGSALKTALSGPLQVQFDTAWLAQDEPLITFRLHEGVKWHDGEPFTSADVKFTYDSFMNEKNASPRRSDFELIKEVEVPDAYTVRVRYKEPYSPCLYTWSYYEIIPRHLLAGEPDLRHLSPGNTFNQFPIGTGAFKMEKWATNQYISLIRNDEYWEGRPHLPRIVYRVIPDPTVSRLEFQTGGFDYSGLDPYEVARFLKDPRYTIFRGPSNSYNYIGWNLKNPLFADRRVRTALACAVDVEAIIKHVMYGNAKPATGPFTPVTPWFNPKIEPIPYDPGRAKQLLAEAGWKPGPTGILEKDGKRFHFTLITNSGVPVRKDIAVLTQQYLRQIGIEVEVIEYEWAVFIKQYIDARNFDACVLGWLNSYDQDIYQIFDSSQIKQDRSLNFVSYSNPEVDRLIAKARTEFDLNKVRQYTQQIQERVYQDQPYLFLFYPESIAAMPKDTFYVRRPGEKAGDWITEPIRRTKVGFGIYQKWWVRGRMPVSDAPAMTPS
jgi:peptide/nickel transport system substrate-binding protein